LRILILKLQVDRRRVNVRMAQHLLQSPYVTAVPALFSRYIICG
jgi:hypothetical protein